MELCILTHLGFNFLWEGKTFSEIITWRPYLIPRIAESVMIKNFLPLFPIIFSLFATAKQNEDYLGLD